MIAKVSEVTRVYRTNEIWREDDQHWQQGGWQERPLVSSKESAELVFQRYAFGHHARIAATALAEVLTVAGQLKQAGEALLSPSSSLDQRTVESSNPNAIIGTANQHSSINSYYIQADQLAKPQINKGNSLASNQATPIASGSNQMKLTMNGRTTSFSVYILPVENNYQVLQKIRGAISQTKAALNVELLGDSSNESSYLQISSRHTGAEQAFSIQDIYGNAAATTGINNVVLQAQDARYHIDGSSSIQSAANDIYLDNESVVLTLLDIAEKPVAVDIRPNMAGIKSQVQALVNRYNSLHLMLTQSVGLLSSEASQVVMGKLSSLPLEQIGIQLNSDGSLRMDTFVLEEQAQFNFAALELSLRGFGGLAAALNVAANKLLDPPSYELLDQGQTLFQSFNNYQFSEWDDQPVNTYLPVPLSGILMNDYI
ncbi:flagellar filament capping protein FliD [Paenibacillus agricola]|uniref:Flagellar filament capping protein FliD n=1 Tax=Paenibacillus agricola TaxID=2716264 RepID=A0ABX0JJ97_9BACL|nr:flagellar filament capping protein FliD [Paenibacillus agricola]NHN34569.1 flagellar filament capping protein FliD [Paenibacillus agricola]